MTACRRRRRDFDRVGHRWRVGAAGSGGFSLLEVLFAVAMLSVALVGLAQLFTVAARAKAGARTTTYAVLLAQRKMEQLRGLAYGFDGFGQEVTDLDTDISVEPERPSGGTGLRPSPLDALDQNTIGYVDYIDASGASLGGGGAVAPPGTAYIRRWSVEPLPASPRTVVLQVFVSRVRDRPVANDGPARRQPNQARIVSVRTRKAP